MNASAALTGFATGLSLILAIGAQNAFVLRQGLRRSFVFTVCLICAASDAVLIALGVSGFGAMTAAVPALPEIMRLAGAAFLLVYGALRLRAAWQGQENLPAAAGADRFWPVVLTCLAFTWLNPHVWLDTVGLLGAVSTGFPGLAGQLSFGLGAATASFVFFFGLGYGARLISPVMEGPHAWQVLDAGVGILMWVLAASLIWVQA